MGVIEAREEGVEAEEKAIASSSSSSSLSASPSFSSSSSASSSHYCLLDFLLQDATKERVAAAGFSENDIEALRRVGFLSARAAAVADSVTVSY